MSKVIGIIKDRIQRTISKEVQEAKIFSVEIDTTQDILYPVKIIALLSCNMLTKVSFSKVIISCESRKCYW